MLTPQDRQNIYGLLAERFEKNSSLSLEEVEIYLKEQGLNYREFDYSSMLELLGDLKEFLTISESADKDQKTTIIFHDYVVTEDTKPQPIKKREHKTRDRLDDQSKKQIYDVLCSNFKIGEEYPMATISKVLLEHSINYRDYGFKQMKALLKELKDQVSLREVTLNGVPQSLVTIKPLTSSDDKNGQKKSGSRKTRRVDESPKRMTSSALSGGDMRADALISKDITTVKKGIDQTVHNPTVSKNSDQTPTENKNSKQQNSVKSSGQNTRKVKKSSEDNNLLRKAEDFIIPPKIINSIKEQAALGLDDDSIIKLIHADYQNALKNKKVEMKEGNILFSLSFKNRSGDELIAAIRQSTSPNSAYDYYMNYFGDSSIRAKDLLKSKIYFTDYDKSIAELARLARKERWCYNHSKDEYIILKIYLQYTFARTVSQHLFHYNETTGLGAFNTGLVSDDYQEIYGLVQKNHLPDAQTEYLFQGFATAGSQGFGKVLVESFNPLPEKATYFDSPEDIFFDPSSQLYTDYNHIIFDNLDRFPLSFLKRTFMPFAQENRILTSILRTDNQIKKETLYRKLSEAVRKNQTLYDLIRSSLYTAIERAKRIVKNDYMMALPSFFPTRNVISIMLPLIFDTTKGPEAVLLVEHNAVGNYQGQTILTLKQCYVNARLIRPLDHTFLDPDRIDD